MIDGMMKIVVLYELSKSELSGYALMNKIQDFSGKRPSPGSIYPLLKDLNSKKLIHFKQRGRKKNYSVTQAGKKAIERIIKEKEKIVMQHMDVLGLVSDITGEQIDSEIIKNLSNQELSKAVMSALGKAEMIKHKVLLLTASKKSADNNKKIIEILDATYKKLNILK